MSHVDDGTLHAYLDGALDAAAAAGLDAHLAGCAACRARMDEERALIARASELLARAAPPLPQREPPPLHQLRHPRLWWQVRTPLAWAATVVLAVAVGWYFRGEVPQRAKLEPATPAEQAARDRQVAAEAPVVAKSKTGPAALQNQAGAPARELDQVAPAPRPSADLALPVAAARGELKVAVRDEAEAWRSIPLADARAILGAAPAALEGLPIRRIQESGAGVVVLEQALDSATVIQLFEQRADHAAGLAEGRAAQRARTDLASERLARYVGGLRVEIAGPLPVDSLSKLLERLKPIPR